MTSSAATALDLGTLTGLGDAVARVRDGFPRELALPRSFADALAAAIAAAEADGDAVAAALRQHYLHVMPGYREERRTSPILQARLAWERAPRLCAAMDALAALTGRAGQGPACRAACPSLWSLYQGTYYGGVMPLLYGNPGELAHLGERLAAGEAAETLVDANLCAPLVHELTHLERDRPALFPIHLDECVAGHLATRVLPSFCVPRAAEEDAIFAAPWLAQVGQALCRVAGFERVLAAHDGRLPWPEALPGGLARAVARVGWREWRRDKPVHLLADPQRPEPWIKLFHLGAGLPLAVADAELDLDRLDAVAWRDIPPPPDSPDDQPFIEDGLRAMCAVYTLARDRYRVTARAPVAPIEIDLDACTTRVEVEGGFEPRGRRYHFPAAVAARHRAAGLRGWRIQLHDIATIPALAAALAAGAPERAPACRVERV